MCPIRIEVTEIQWGKPPHEYEIGPDPEIQYVGGNLFFNWKILFSAE